MGQSIEPKRHHYIPQFILRNFNDKNSQINYWDISAKELQKRNTRSVFMNKNMYRDEVNYPAHPTLIESTLADFEAEISEIINGKLLSTNEVVITRTELEKLRIFYHYYHLDQIPERISIRIINLMKKLEKCLKTFRQMTLNFFGKRS